MSDKRKLVKSKNKRSVDLNQNQNKYKYDVDTKSSYFQSQQYPQLLKDAKHQNAMAYAILNGHKNILKELLRNNNKDQTKKQQLENKFHLNYSNNVNDSNDNDIVMSTERWSNHKRVTKKLKNKNRLSFGNSIDYDHLSDRKIINRGNTNYKNQDGNENKTKIREMRASFLLPNFGDKLNKQHSKDSKSSQELMNSISPKLTKSLDMNRNDNLREMRASFLIPSQNQVNDPNTYPKKLINPYKNKHISQVNSTSSQSHNPVSKTQHRNTSDKQFRKKHVKKLSSSNAFGEFASFLTNESDQPKNSIVKFVSSSNPIMVDGAIVNNDVVNIQEKLFSSTSNPIHELHFPIERLGKMLHSAVKKGNLNQVLPLVKHPNVHSFVNQSDRNGSTCIFHCAWTGDVTLTAILIAHFGDVNHRNFRGNSALHLAIEKNHLPLVEYLLQVGADTVDIDVDQIRRRSGRKISRKIDEIVAKFPPLTDKQRAEIKLYRSSGYGSLAGMIRRKPHTGHIELVSEEIAEELARDLAKKAMEEYKIELEMHDQLLAQQQARDKYEEEKNALNTYDYKLNTLTSSLKTSDSSNSNLTESLKLLINKNNDSKIKLKHSKSKHNVLEWTPSQVAVWISKLGKEFIELAKSTIIKNIGGKQLVALVTRSKSSKNLLKYFDIPSNAFAKLSKEIRMLRDNCDQNELARVDVASLRPSWWDTPNEYHSILIGFGANPMFKNMDENRLHSHSPDANEILCELASEPNKQQQFRERFERMQSYNINESNKMEMISNISHTNNIQSDDSDDELHSAPPFLRRHSSLFSAKTCENVVQRAKSHIQHLEEGDSNLVISDYTNILDKVTRTNLIWIFDTIDRLGSGFLTLEDIATFNRQMDPSLSQRLAETDAKAFIEWVDLTQNELISQTEFIIAWKRLARRDGIGVIHEFIKSYNTAMKRSYELGRIQNMHQRLKKSVDFRQCVQNNLQAKLNHRRTMLLHNKNY